MQNFISFLMVLIIFELFEHFLCATWKPLLNMVIYLFGNYLIKIVSSRLRSELCVWGVKLYFCLCTWSLPELKNGIERDK